MKKHNSYQLFTGEWNASRIIESLSELSKLKRLGIMGPISIEHYEYDNSNPWAIKYYRLASALSAYGRSIYFSNSRWMFCDLISSKRSNEKLSEIRDILMNLVSSSKAIALSETINSANQNDNIRGLSEIAFIIFKLYLYYKILNNPFDGIFELSTESFHSLQFVEELSSNSTAIIQDRLIQLLVLIMGDDFDTPISEQELIDKYNYPTISDEQLQTLISDYDC